MYEILTCMSCSVPGCTVSPFGSIFKATRPCIPFQTWFLLCITVKLNTAMAIQICKLRFHASNVRKPGYGISAFIRTAITVNDLRLHLGTFVSLPSDRLPL